MPLQQTKSSNSLNPELEAITSVLNDYILGSTGGQPDRLRSAFHPQLNLYSVRDDQVRVWPGEDYIRSTKPGEPTGEKGRILAIDFEHDCAVAKVEIVPEEGASYIDYFMLLKTNGTWKIIHKMFTKKDGNAAAFGEWSATALESNAHLNPVESHDRKTHGDIPAPVKNQEQSLPFDERALPEKMSAFSGRYLAEQHLPGLAIVVVRDGKTIYKQGFGYADLASKKSVDADQTIFRIGSISKALTLLVLARKIDQGIVQRKSPVSQWTRSFSNPGNIQEPLTIDHLLTHTSGLDQIDVNRQVRKTHLAFEDRRKFRGGLDEFLTASNLRRINRPGTTYRYDTYGTTLAGFILGKLVEADYASAMQQEMFDVLGMASTSVEVRDLDRDRLATGYLFNDGQYQARPYEFYRSTPASSIDATAGDMARLLEALTSDGANASGRLFSAEMLNKVCSPYFRIHPEFCGVSHGFFESWTSDESTANVHLRSLGHGGSMDGYRAALTLIPSQKLGIFVVANRSPSRDGGPVDFRPIIDVVLSSFRGAPKKMPLEIPTVVAEDLSEYSGEFFYGMYCHSMTAADQGQGAWLRPRATLVSLDSGGLRIGEELYVRKSDDLFVESTGRRMLLFSRDVDGKIESFTYSTSPDTFERAYEGYQEFPSLAQRFYELARDGKLLAAQRFFQQEREQGNFYIREAEFNNTGYALLQEDHTQAAIAAFQINTELFPNSWNAHDSLGEALAAAGRTEEAVASYNQSIQLNPNNTAGKQRLLELQR